ncbi:MAG: VWA domain-containing protein [Chloroflexota bacterium]
MAVVVEEVATSIKRLYRCLAALLLPLTLAAPVAEAANLSVSVQQIDVSQFPQVQGFVSVTDSQGIPIAGLDNRAFQVLEDGTAVSNFSFNPVINSQEPIAVTFVLDISGSMNDNGKLAGAKQATDAFIDTMAPNDSAALITFSDTVNLNQGYTHDKNVLKNAVGQLKANGNTAIYDAVAKGASLQSSTNARRRIMLLMTDGDDNRSKESVDGAIAAAKTSGTPVFVVGLGTDVKKDVLDKIAGSTGGQAVYAATGDQLQKDFLYLSDELRREYSFQYTSSLAPDGKEHKVTVKATYHAETAESTGTFVPKAPPIAMTVTGISDAARVSGPQTVQVSISSGTAKQVELLVDGTSVATAAAPPYNLAWDASKLTPGSHKVTVRATDSAGNNTDQTYTIDVAAPVVAPTAAAVVATVAPQPSPVVATVVPAPAAAATTTGGPVNPLYYAIAAAVVALLAIGGLVAFLVTRRPKVAIALPVPAPTPSPPPVMSDRTEVIGPPPAPPPPPRPASDATVVGAGDATVVGGNATVVSAVPPAPRLPKGRLIVVQNGAKTEVPIQQVETMLGREATNPVVIKDPMSSRRHAKIVIENGEFWIEDLKSLNGTRVNGEVITRRKLASNDQIKVGDATMTFVAE